jgi:hypothetical protein
MEEIDCYRTSSPEEIRPKPRLLELLRQQLIVIVVFPLHERGGAAKKELILEHISEFPFKLRELISEASGGEFSETSPEIFLSMVYELVKVFLFGQIIPNENADDDEVEEWELSGLDSDFDTEEEVEVAIRFFPRILTERLPPSLRSHLYTDSLTFMLMISARAISFVPLFLKLGALCDRREIWRHLLVNRIIERVFGEESPPELDEESLSVLECLQEKDLVRKEDISEHGLLLWLLNRARNEKPAFIETRLRFLVDSDPSVLRAYDKYYSLLYKNAGGLRKFENIFYLGMTYFPMDLGFLFHKSTFQGICSYLHDTERIADIVRDKVMSYLRESKHTLQNLVFAAATNNAISLDGLYILICCNPIELMPESSTKILKRRKRRRRRRSVSPTSGREKKKISC